MNWRRLIVFNRIPIAIGIIILGIIFTFTVKHAAWWTWILFVTAILMVVAHYMIGPMSLIQKHMEDGDVEGAQALLNSIKKTRLVVQAYPQWLLHDAISTWFFG